MNNDANAGTNSSASGRCWSLSQMTDKAALTDPLNISLIIAALLCLALFVRVELRQAHPLLSLRDLRYRRLQPERDHRRRTVEKPEVPGMTRTTRRSDADGGFFRGFLAVFLYI